MAFWQENYAFIKDVYDDRSKKMIEVMDKTDASIAEVLADKIYTSNDFKKVKEIFTGLAKNLEQSEVKEWLESTKETLMGDRDQKSRGDEEKKLKDLLDRYNQMLPKVAETRTQSDSLWKAYQFTDELAPHMEWLMDRKALATRDINSNSAGETEELIEKQEKVLDTLDKKRKVIMEVIARGQKLKDDPKSPAFLAREVAKMKDTWDETNAIALDRLNRLRDNMSAWERYETKRNDLADKVASAHKELEDIKKVYDLSAGPEDVKKRQKDAASIRKNIEEIFNTVKSAKETVETLLTEDMQAELSEQVEDLKTQIEVNTMIDEKIQSMDTFNGKLKKFSSVLTETENWLLAGRKRMDDLLNPPAPIDAEERVLNTMELGEDIRKQLDIQTEQQTLWDTDLAPTQAGEETPECTSLISRMSSATDTLSGLNSEAETEAAKFGEDVKYLAEFQNSVKKFTPWIEKSEQKVKTGLGKPASLEEATELLAHCKVYKDECTAMKKVIDDGNASAGKMTMHDDADKQYAVYVQRWTQVDKTVDDWIKRMEGLVAMWKEQAATADKVTAAISAPAASDMKLEDLESHLNSLKKMFIEKQRMMDQMNMAQQEIH